MDHALSYCQGGQVTLLSPGLVGVACHVSVSCRGLPRTVWGWQSGSVADSVVLSHLTTLLIAARQG